MISHFPNFAAAVILKKYTQLKESRERVANRVTKSRPNDEMKESKSHASASSHVKRRGTYGTTVM